MMRMIEDGMLGLERAKARAGSRRRLDEAVGAFGTDSPALLGLMACRITHSARFARCVRTDAASQLLKRAARAAMSPAVLGVSYARRRPPARSFAAPVVTGQSNTTIGSRRDRGHPSGAISGSASSAAPRRGAHAVRASTSDSRILFERSERSSRSELCALARAEQASPDENSPGDCSRLASGRAARRGAACKASAVGAQRRPTQHEPLAGAPWRDARRSSNA
jgi:hypothetical protein